MFVKIGKPKIETFRTMATKCQTKHDIDLACLMWLAGRIAEQDTWGIDQETNDELRQTGIMSIAEIVNNLE